MRKISMAVAAVAASLTAAVVGLPAQATGTPTYDVVADGLHNPRQLTFSPTGVLYVAEAGTGGTKPCFAGGEGGQVCFGRTGSVTQVANGVQTRVASKLPSIGDQGTGDSALGPADVALFKAHHLAVTIGLGTDPANRANLPPAARRMGTIMNIGVPSGDRWIIADLAAHEAATNPIDDPDSDPTGLIWLQHRFVATDSGGNTLVSARRNGTVDTIAAFPDTPITGGSYQAVPTDVAKGPDGALYVTELTGFPFIPGVANIYRVVPGHAPTVYASGLTNLTSLAFAPDGTLYAVQIADAGLASGGPPVGSLLRVAPDGSGQTTQAVASGLFAPYGVALHDGSAYVSVCSVCAEGGQVVRVPLS